VFYLLVRRGAAPAALAPLPAPEASHD
jgi:hypothetical protein